MSKDTMNLKKDGGELVTKLYLSEQFEKFEHKIDAKFDDLASIIKQQFDHVDERFVGLETRMTGLETRMTGLEGRMDALEGKVDGIHGFLYRHIEQSDQRFMETNSTVRLHDQWIRRASRKTRISYPVAPAHRR